MKLAYPIKVLMRPELISDNEDGLIGFAREIAQRFNLPTTLIKFVIVGGIGFVIYQSFFAIIYDTPALWFLPDKNANGSLVLFTHPDIRLFIASVVAVEIAIFFQFNAHERWTFRNRDREGNLLFRFVKFNASSFVSPLIIVVTVNVMASLTSITPYFWNLVGVVIGFAWNWLINSLVIWPHLRRTAPGSPRSG